MFVLAYTVQGWCDGFEAPEVGLTSRLWWFRWKIRCILIPGLPWKVCFCFLFSHNSWHQIVKKGMTMIIIPWTFQAINTCWVIFCDELCLKQIQFRDSEDRLKNETFHLQQKKTHKKKRRTSGGFGGYKCDAHIKLMSMECETLWVLASQVNCGLVFWHKVHLQSPQSQGTMNHPNEFIPK